MSEEEGVIVGRGALQDAVRDLDIIVVSLARLGSAHADRDDIEQGTALVKFVDDWDVFAKLARVRRTLNERSWLTYACARSS